MVDIFKTSLNISFAEKGNKTIYYLKKIPVIGDKIPDKLYKSEDGKFVYGIIGLINTIIFKFIGKTVFTLLLIYLTSYSIGKISQNLNVKNLELEIFVVMCMLLDSIGSSCIFNFEGADAYKMIKLMRMNPKKYYVKEIIMRVCGDFIFFMPVMFFIDIGNPILILLESSCFTIIGEYINIVLFDKKNFVICNKLSLIIALFIILAAAVCIPAYFGLSLNLKVITDNYIFSLIMLLLASLVFIKILNYTGFKKIAAEVNFGFSAMDEVKTKSDIAFSDVKLKKINKKLLDTKKFDKKSGYEYLNSIFFFRNNKFVKRSIEIKIAIITIALILLTCAVLFFIDKPVDESFEVIKKLSPCLMFFMYMISSTESICKSMFYNCDLAFLRYGFYRRPKDILNNFKSRIRKLLFYNSIPTLVLVIEFSAFIIIIGEGNRFIEIVPYIICIICLNCFFTLYSVFMYYILQPYTKGLEVKSPVFKIVNFIVYAGSYGILRMEIELKYFTLAVIILTVVFIPIAFYTIYKYASRTFRLK